MTLRWMRLLEKLTLAQIEFGDTLLLEFISLPIPWALVLPVTRMICSILTHPFRSL